MNENIRKMVKSAFDKLLLIMIKGIKNINITKFMKKSILLIALFIHGIASSQIYKEFWNLRGTADSLFKIADYNGASDNYMRLFQLETPKDRVNLYRYTSARACHVG